MGKYKILITGAEGFIGRNLTKDVLKEHSPRDVLLFVKKGNAEKFANIAFFGSIVFLS